MEFPDPRLRDLKRDWTRFKSAPNHESDSTMIHGKRLKTGESSWHGMHPSQNIHEPSGKGFYKDVEMEDVNEKPINRQEEVSHKLDPCNESLQEFENWSNMLSKLSLTKDLQRRVEEKKDTFKKATKHLFQSRNWLDSLGKDPERFSEDDD
ncbi:hypothetical protein PCANC_15999 [Puccinia coronata f. sp. avenae]|uniref:Uncharacterized protein n=1 Tax=Puccinia coronata f. sp. avenae TaxID=200324 RepID=A0A2N5VQ56_9BASI|nr:hypothetical protein PCASD_20893 [Puccinia coronata f. sp. avenae]PLW52086.1 hypothetical protein PCASD_02161 [Puccinia coronata f. sp. avenae]PLW52710.1 hypothetical protein PCANC_15999 [Puccinia coronata f. sp. avenae]